MGVESWLRRLPLAKSSCAKIRGLLSVLFNHACRYELFDRNPIRLVRQGAKRRSTPSVLTPSEIKALLSGLRLRERALVLVAASTGLRQSELFGLKWGDIDFAQNTMSVTRSIVCGVVRPCKTESSQKPVPVHPTVFGVPLEIALYVLPNAKSIRLYESGSLLHVLHKWTVRTCFNAQEEIFQASMDEIAQLGEVHPELVRYIGPPCHLRTGITTPICTEGSHFCGVNVWLDFPNVPRRI